MDNTLIDKLKAVQQLIIKQPNTSEYLYNDNTLGLKDCKICNGIGMILRKEDGITYSRECECFNKKLSQERFSKTEIANKKEYTFKNYKASEKWQKDILKKSKNYVSNFRDNWFYIVGQIGAGKTHICTSILRNIGELNNISYTYIKCDEELEKLKQLAYEQREEYSKIIFNLKNTGLLFIDDFFRRIPTETDKVKIFDIINFRYLNNKPCILSSEKTLFEILSIDEAIGSRIFEKAKNFNIEIEKGFSKNYRLSKQ